MRGIFIPLADHISAATLNWEGGTVLQSWAGFRPNAGAAARRGSPPFQQVCLLNILCRQVTPVADRGDK